MELRVYTLLDGKREMNENLLAEIEQNQLIFAENEQLKNQINALLAQLKQEKAKNAEFDSKLQAEKDKYSKQMEEQRQTLNDFEVIIETKSNELQAKDNIIRQIQAQHDEQMRNLRFEMEALQSLNYQLKEENKTAVDVVDIHQRELKKHRKQITNAHHENDIIARQLQQLQAHFSVVVQHQIEADEQMARQAQEEEHAKNVATKGGPSFNPKMRQKDLGAFSDEDDAKEDVYGGGMGHFVDDNDDDDDEKKEMDEQNNPYIDDNLEETMKLIQLMKDKDMAELTQRQIDLEERVRRDTEIAKAIHAQQSSLHQEALKKYGSVVYEKEVEAKLKQKEERKRKREMKKKNAAMNNYNDQQDKYYDPHDGMGLIIPNDDY